jgi:hypothetical protein
MQQATHRRRPMPLHPQPQPTGNAPPLLRLVPRTQLKARPSVSPPIVGNPLAGPCSRRAANGVVPRGLFYFLCTHRNQVRPLGRLVLHHACRAPRQSVFVPNPPRTPLQAAPLHPPTPGLAWARATPPPAYAAPSRRDNCTPFHPLTPPVRAFVRRDVLQCIILETPADTALPTPPQQAAVRTMMHTHVRH